jgi:hypothetical protein
MSEALKHDLSRQHVVNYTKNHVELFAFFTAWTSDMVLGLRAG